MIEAKANKRLSLISAILVLTLVLFPVLGYGSNGLTSAEQSQVEDILTNKYAELPGVELEFGEPAATYESVTFRPFSNLAISVPNLTDGIVIGVVTYGDVNYLLMAVELPQEIGANYGAGLVDFSTNEAVFAAGAELSSQEGSVDQISFEMSSAGGDSPNLDLVVDGRKYVIKTIIPKSL